MFIQIVKFIWSASTWGSNIQIQMYSVITEKQRQAEILLEKNFLEFIQKDQNRIHYEVRIAQFLEACDGLELSKRAKYTARFYYTNLLISKSKVAPITSINFIALSMAAINCSIEITQNTNLNHTVQNKRYIQLQNQMKQKANIQQNFMTPYDVLKWAQAEMQLSEEQIESIQGFIDFAITLTAFGGKSAEMLSLGCLLANLSGLEKIASFQKIQQGYQLRHYLIKASQIICGSEREESQQLHQLSLQLQIL